MTMIHPDTDNSEVVKIQCWCLYAAVLFGRPSVRRVRLLPDRRLPLHRVHIQQVHHVGPVDQRPDQGRQPRSRGYHAAAMYQSRQQVRGGLHQQQSGQLTSVIQT